MGLSLSLTRCELTQRPAWCCTDLLDVLFDLSGDERVVDDRQHHGRVMARDPTTNQQPAVSPVTALREEDLQHHGDSSVFSLQQL